MPVRPSLLCLLAGSACSAPTDDGPVGPTGAVDSGGPVASTAADTGPTGQGTDTGLGPLGDPAVLALGELQSEHFRQFSAQAELPDGRIFVTGGLIVRSPAGGGGARATGQEATEIYDLANRTVEEIDPLHEGRTGATATVLPDGRVLVLGGLGGPADDRIVRSSAEIFDPTTGASTLLTESMTQPRINHGAWLMGQGPLAGSVLVVGGDAPPTAEVYDPVAGTFAALPAADPPLEAPGALGAVRLLGDGRVLLLGCEDAGGASASAYLYDPVAGEFSEVPGFGGERSRFSATPLDDGRLLIAGGWGPSGGLTDLRMFDPATDTIEPLKVQLDEARYLHAAGRLGSGKIALISGLPEVAVFHDDVVVFDPVTEELSVAEGAVGLARAYAQGLSLSRGDVFVIGGQITIGSGPNTAIVSNVDVITERPGR